ncbi:MAG TPA: alpha-L-rhamnosidase C-terminal domain-containing protein, partial [Puia sp.]|nr:alpha-L-rhamnosidase C-terminal domain-containing protein [Puia sp.]
GFRKVKIEPHLGELTRVNGEVPHPNGKVAVSYVLVYDPGKPKWNIKVELPAGISGVLVWKGKTYPLAAGENTFAI